MNKIYKVIWSKVKNCYVVVSEIAKGQGKSSKGAEISLRAMLCAMSLVGATMAFPTSYVEAADNVTGAGTGVTIGTGSSTNGSSDVAIGRDAKTASDASVAIGYNTQAYATDGVALGHNARSGKAGSAVNNNAVAIGNGSIGEGQSSLALGNNSWATGTGATALGNSSRSVAEKATAIGNNSYAAGSNSFAMGQEALSAGFGASALGPSSFVNGNNSVAVGSNAKIGWLKLKRAGTGNSDADKQIIGYDEDTQVKNAAAIGYMAAAYTDGSAAVGQGATAGSLREPGTKHALALGGYAQAYALNSIAIGSAEIWDADHNKADDTTTTRASGNNSIAIGTNARSDKENGIALGTRAKATNINSISVGVGNVVNGDNSGIFGGSNSKAGYPLLRPNIVEGQDTYIIGNNNGTVRAYRSMAFGNNNNLETSVEGIHILGNNNKVTLQGGTVIGNFSEVTATDAVVIGNNAKVSHDNSVAIGSNATTEAIVSTPSANINGKSYNFAGGEAKATVSVGANEVAGAAGDNFKHYYRTITNVAAGRISDTSTDAINGSQLYAVEKEVSKGLDFAGDNGLSINKKLGQQIDIVGGADPSQLTDNNIGVNNDNGKLKVQLAKNIVLGTDGSLSAGNTVIDEDGILVTDADTKQVTTYTGGGLAIADPTNHITTMVTKDGIFIDDGKVKLTEEGLNNGGNQITNVKSGISDPNNLNNPDDDTNAANIGDVKNISKDAADQAVTNATFGLTAEDSQAVTNNVNKTVKVVGDNQAIETKIDGDKLVVALKDDMNVGQAGPNGKDGSIGVNGKDGSAVVINGKDGSIGAKGADGISGVAINGKDGSIGLTGANGKDATIKVAEDGQPTLDGSPTDRIEVDGHQVATMDDGIKYTGDQGSAAIKLNNNTAIVGGATASLTDNNIGVVASQEGDNAKLTVKLAKDINLGQNGSVTTGDTKINNEGLTIQNGPSVTKDGINAGDQVVTHVGSGRDGSANEDTNAANIGDVKDISKDAANQAVNNGKYGLKGETGEVQHTINGDSIEVIGDQKAIETKVEDGKLVIAMKPDVNVGGDGKDGSITVKDGTGKDTVTINGKDGSIGLTGANGKDATIKVAEDGQPTLDGSPTDRIEVDGHQVATMDDGIKYTGDQGSAAIKLNNNTAIVGGATGSLTDNNIGVVASQEGDNAKLTVKLAKDINLGQNGSVTTGDTTINNEGLTIQNGPSVTKDGINAGDQVVTHVGSGRDGSANEDTNAANIGDVKDISKDAVNNATFGLTAEDNQVVTNNINKTVKVVGDNQAIETKIDGDKLVVALKDDMNVGQAGPNGKDGSIGVNGKDGSAVVINGKDGSIGAKGADGISGVAINGKDGSIGLTGANGKDATIKVAEDGQPTLDGSPTDRIEVDGHQVATMDDGIKYTGDQGSAAIKLNKNTAIVGGATGSLTDNNIGVVASQEGDNAKLIVKLAKDINLGQDGSLTTGNTTINNGGLTIQNGPSVTQSGINAGDQVVTHVKSGIVNGDASDNANAANIGDVKDISKNIADQAVDHAVSGLKEDIADAGAHAAALAALKPIQYDPMEPTQIMAGVGGYKGARALALGVAHYKNESTLFHAGVAVGSHETMYNAGVTWKFGNRHEEAAIPDRYKAGPISSVYVMQDEVSAMKAQNNQLLAENKAQKDQLAQQDMEMKAMKAQIQMLMEKVGL